MDIVTLGPPELSEFLPKPLGPGLRFRIVLGKGHQDTDMAHALGLLRPRGKRPCSQGAKRGDELAPPHVLLTLRLKMTAYYIEWKLLCVTAKLGANVRFGSKADICSAKQHVRFTPKSGRSAVDLVAHSCPLLRRGHRADCM